MLLGFAAQNAEANWLGRVSLTTMEGYANNILFSDKNEKDFVSSFIPTMTLIHESPWQTVPDFTAHLSVAGEYFAQHPALNNFGDEIRLDTAYLYPYSPRLNFTVMESLERLGASRTGNAQGTGGGGVIGGSSGQVASVVAVGVGEENMYKNDLLEQREWVC